MVPNVHCRCVASVLRSQVCCVQTLACSFLLLLTVSNKTIVQIILFRFPFFSRLRSSLMASYIWCILTPPDCDNSSRHSVRSLSALANAVGVMHAHSAS